MRRAKEGVRLAQMVLELGWDIIGKKTYHVGSVENIPRWLREHFRFLQSKSCIADQ